jgi:hypothetical protein
MSPWTGAAGTLSECLYPALGRRVSQEDSFRALSSLGLAWKKSGQKHGTGQRPFTMISVRPPVHRRVREVYCAPRPNPSVPYPGPRRGLVKNRVSFRSHFLAKIPREAEAHAESPRRGGSPDLPENKKQPRNGREPRGTRIPSPISSRNPCSKFGQNLGTLEINPRRGAKDGPNRQTWPSTRSHALRGNEGGTSGAMQGMTPNGAGPGTIQAGRFGHSPIFWNGLAAWKLHAR